MPDPAVPAAARPAARTEVEEFLFHEAALLDARDFDRWLELFAQDATYWIPSGSDELDPDRQVSIVYDGLPRMRERVARLASGIAWAQEPPSRTLHLIGNVAASFSSELVTVTSSLVVTEFRRGRQHLHAGRCRHELRRAGEDFEIVLKKIELINNDGFLGNLSILL